MNDSRPKRTDPVKRAGGGAERQARRDPDQQGEDSAAATTRARSNRGARADSDHRTRTGVRGVLTSVRDFASEIGWEICGISGVSTNEEGWVVSVDVVELHRIPSTTDLIGVYEVTVDPDHEVTAYIRNRHYVRGRGDNERGTGTA